MINYKEVATYLTNITTSEEASIKKIVETLNLANVNISADVDETHTVLAMALLRLGYTFFKARIKIDGKHFKPQSQHDYKHIESGLYSQTVGDTQDFVARWRLNKDLLITVTQIQGESRYILPVWLSKEYPDRYLEFYDHWAIWLDKKEQDRTLTLPEEYEYLGDFFEYFVRNLPDTVDVPNDGLGRAMRSILNVFPYRMYFDAARDFLEKSDSDLCEKIVIVLASVKLENTNTRIESFLEDLFKIIKSRNLRISRKTRNLITILRMPIYFQSNNGEALDSGSIEEMVGSVGVNTKFRELVYHIGSYIAENFVGSSDNHPYFDRINLVVKKNHTSLTFKVTSHGGVVPRYLKIGRESVIENEKSGILKFEDQISADAPVQVAKLKAASFFDGCGLIGSIEVAGKSLSDTYNETDDGDIMYNILRGLLSVMTKHVYTRTQSPNLIATTLGTYYMVSDTPKMTGAVRKLIVEKKLQTRTCLVHGDFHVDNIYYYRDSQGKEMYYLIDFEYTDISHYLKDFIRLEVSVRLQLMDHKAAKRAETLVDQIKQEGDQAKIASGIQTNWLPLLEKWLIADEKHRECDAEINKARQAIKAIRETATELSIFFGINPADFMSEYTLCLIWNLYEYLEFRDILEIKKYYASRLLERLENGLAGTTIGHSSNGGLT